MIEPVLNSSDAHHRVTSRRAATLYVAAAWVLGLLTAVVNRANYPDGRWLGGHEPIRLVAGHSPRVGKHADIG